jgi:uncharacterized protein YecT (DUF1311 family)
VRQLPLRVPGPGSRVPTFLVLALLLTTPLHAQFAPHPIEAELTRCLESPEGMSTHGMRACMGAATEAWDKELNRVWRELMAELPTAPKEQLRVAQRKWIAFRDAELEAIAGAYGAMGGSMFLIMHADAVSTLTRDRVRQLDALLDAQRVSVQ